MKNIVLVLLAFIILSGVNTSGTYIDTDQEYIVTVEDYGDGDFILGKADGTVEIYTDWELERQYSTYPGRNQIVDVEYDDDYLIMVSQYNYTEIRNRTTGDLLKRIYHGIARNVEWKQAGILLISEMRGLIELNVSSGEIVATYDMFTIEYLDDVTNPPQCINCLILDMKVVGSDLIVLQGGGVYWIDLESMVIRKSISVDFLTSEMSIDKSDILLIERGQEYVTLYRDGELTRIETNFRVVDADINGDEVVVGGERRVEIKNINDNRWERFESQYEVGRVQYIEAKIFVGYRSKTSNHEMVIREDFEKIPLVSKNTSRLIMIAIGLLLIITIMIKMVDPINRKIIDIQLKSDAKRGGFKSVEMYRDALQKGFEDSRIMQMIQNQGYRTYRDYVRSIEALNKAGMSLIKEAKEKRNEERHIESRDNTGKISEIKVFVKNSILLMFNLISEKSGFIAIFLGLGVIATVIVISIMNNLVSVIIVMSLVLLIQAGISYKIGSLRNGKTNIMLLALGIFILLSSVFAASPGVEIGMISGDPIDIRIYDNKVRVYSGEEYVEIEDGEIIKRVSIDGIVEVWGHEDNFRLITEDGTIYDYLGVKIAELNENNVTDYYKEGNYEYILKDHEIVIISVEQNNRTEILYLPISPIESCSCDLLEIAEFNGNIFFYTKQGYRYTVHNGKIINFELLSNDDVKNVKVTEDAQLLIKNDGVITVLGKNDTIIVEIRDADMIIDASWEDGVLIYSTVKGIKRWEDGDVRIHEIIIPVEVPMLVGEMDEIIFIVNQNNEVKIIEDVRELFGRYYQVKPWQMIIMLSGEIVIVGIVKNKHRFGIT